MGFYEDPDQMEDFPEDNDDYESSGYQYLDADGRYLMELFTNADIEITDEYVAQLIEDLIVSGGLNEFAAEMEDYAALFKPPDQIDPEALRANPFFSAGDAINYLEGIPGYMGFAGLTWINGIWHIWVGDTI